MKNERDVENTREGPNPCSPAYRKEDLATDPALRAWLRFSHSSLTAAQQRVLGTAHTLDLRNLFVRPAANGQYPLPFGITVKVDEEAVDRDLCWATENSEHYLLPIDHPAYPAALKEIYDPPWILYVVGKPQLLNRPFIAIVGSRNPSAGGRVNAKAFAHALGESGWGIVSGLATGIDACAHEGALHAAAVTVAVLGTGPEQVYPRCHRALAQQIARRGALVTEFPPGTPARRHHFPLRNRIISGMSRAVLVVEASLRSGSLITARLAADQGREVCAIPGSIHLPTARGCHRLIRQGAKLVECAHDIHEELGYASIQPVDGREKSSSETTDEFHDMLLHLGHDPVTVDELINRSGLTADSVSSMLLRMEVRGLVATLPGGRYQRLGA